MVFYSDGAPEAANRSGELYGYEGLQSFFVALPSARLTARAILGATVDELAPFARGSRRQDDTTLVVVKVL